MKTFSDYVTSAIAAAEAAWRRMILRLFTNGTLEVWLVLGLSAWLVNPGQGGGFLNFPLNSQRFWGGSADLTLRLQQWTIHAMEWTRLHLPLVLIVGTLGTLLLIIIGLVMLWLGSRAQFTFLAGVARDKVEFKNPWQEFREPGWSLFLWRLAFTLISGAVWLLLLGFGTGLIFLVFQQGAAVIMAMAIVLVCLALTLALLNLCIIRCLEDFVVPLMYKYRFGAVAAWRYFGEICRTHGWGIVAYLLAWIVLAVIAFLAVVAVILLTCCVAGCLFAVPYVGAVLLLPVSVFFRCFSLYFLESLHPDFKMIQAPLPPAPPPVETAPPITPA